jgi:Fe-S cluster biogenesis protein NfuA
MSATESSATVLVTPEATPNPQSLKFRVDRQISDESKDFRRSNEPIFTSPLAKKIFGFPWAEGVFIGTDFVTITKQEWVDWDVLAEPLAGLIAEHIERGETVLSPADKAPAGAASSDSPEVQLIKRIIDEEIRPAVAMDGGDIVFQKYEDKIVYLFMQGSCAGCPSSTYTLREGITTRLKSALPEIQDVISV